MGTVPTITDRQIPTEPVRIQAKWTGLTGNNVLGSATILRDKQGQITLREILCGSAETWFAICDKTGTVQTMYMEAAGVDREKGTIYEPIETLSPGSIRVRVLNASSAGSYGVNLRVDLI